MIVVAQMQVTHHDDTQRTPDGLFRLQRQGLPHLVLIAPVSINKQEQDERRDAEGTGQAVVKPVARHQPHQPTKVKYEERHHQIEGYHQRGGPRHVHSRSQRHRHPVNASEKHQEEAREGCQHQANNQGPPNSRQRKYLPHVPADIGTAQQRQRKEHESPHHIHLSEGLGFCSCKISLCKCTTKTTISSMNG